MKIVRNIIVLVVACVGMFFVGSAVGSSNTEVKLNNKKVALEDIEKTIKHLKIKESDARKEVKKQQKELVDQEEKTKKVVALISKEDEVHTQVKESAKELQEIRGKIEEEKKNLENEKSKVAKQQKELASLTGKIEKAKSQPKVLSAGTYTCGTDFPAGRYKATPVGDGSNFITFDSSGTPDVNTVLGKFGEESYVFYIEEGYTLQTEAKVKLTPVE
ncbi:hypothetical protein [Priestia koreensis]|uniref:hypothetical protein n=1 Tax=Priestia koreensis TaxID=284581 RepID=UPI00203C406F|nr:hypothetical protein [Priestia koreensis]MCM3005411.1 hypothetical protein [Priestia koreensis]